MATQTVRISDDLSDPDGLSLNEEVNDAAARIAERHGNINWEIGEEADRLISKRGYGEGVIAHFSEALSERGINVSPDSIYRFRRVYAAFPEISERYKNLSFSHHDVACYREDRLELLQMAQHDGLSVRALAQLVVDRNYAEQQAAEDAARAQAEQQASRQTQDADPTETNAARSEKDEARAAREAEKETERTAAQVQKAIRAWLTMTPDIAWQKWQAWTKNRKANPLTILTFINHRAALDEELIPLLETMKPADLAPYFDAKVLTKVVASLEAKIKEQQQTIHSLEEGLVNAQEALKAAAAA